MGLANFRKSEPGGQKDLRIHPVWTDIAHNCYRHVPGTIVLQEEALDLLSPKSLYVPLEANDWPAIVVVESPQVEFFYVFPQRRVVYSRSALFQYNPLFRVELSEDRILQIANPIPNTVFFPLKDRKVYKSVSWWATS